MALVLLALATLPPRPAHASPAGMAEGLDAYLDEAFPASDIPGMAVAVVDADGTDYLRTFGDVASADETFVVGSLSKSMTALAIQQLVDGASSTSTRRPRTARPATTCPQPSRCACC